MRDKNGDNLHIGELVTFSEDARPRWLIGRKGIVERWGDKYIKVNLDSKHGMMGPVSFVRVDPGVLLLGDHTIVHPVLSDPQFVLTMHNAYTKSVSRFLGRALQKGIISAEQYQTLLKTLQEN